MKYKLLKELPDANVGDIFNIDASSRFEFYRCKDVDYPKEVVENKPDWFTPYLFTTEDGVDIYKGDDLVALVLKGYNNGKIKKNDIINIVTSDDTLIYWNKDTWKFFSTRQAAEKYLEKQKINRLLEEAKVKYPIGTKYKCLHLECNIDSGKERIINHHNFNYIDTTSSCNVASYIIGITDSYNGFLYLDGKWAEIVENKYSKSWEDLKKIKGYNHYSVEIHCKDFQKLTQEDKKYWKSISSTQKQAESMVAFAQLSQLLAEINGNWQPNWNDHDECKYVIDREFDTIYKGTTTVIFHPLAFKTKEARDFSFQHCEELWKKYWQI